MRRPSFEAQVIVLLPCAAICGAVNDGAACEACTEYPSAAKTTIASKHQKKFFMAGTLRIVALAAESAAIKAERNCERKATKRAAARALQNSTHCNVSHTCDAVSV